MPLPGDINVITITGDYTDLFGNASAGQVVFSLSTPLTDSTGHVILAAGVYPAPLVNGRFSITLPCTDNSTLSPTNFAYAVSEQVTGVGRSYLIQVPHSLGATVDISTLVPVNPPTPYSTIYGVLANNQTWTGKNTFNGETVVATPVNAGDAATKAYVDAHAGVASVNGQTGTVVLTAGNVGALAAANNLSDLANAGTARTNLGLGSAATENANTTAGNIAALGTQAAGAVGQTADAGHVHPMPRLDQVLAPTAAVGLNAQKITSLANGSGPQDAAAFGQIPTPGAVTAQTSFGLTSANGTATTYSHSDHGHGTPSNTDRYAQTLGLVAEPYPMQCCNHFDLGLSPGFLIAMLVRPGQVTVNNLGLWLVTAGATSTGVNVMGLYSEAGALLASTGDMTSALSTAGNNNTYVEAAVGTPVACTEATNYYVAVLSHMSTIPVIAGTLGASETVIAVKGHYPAIEVSGQASLPSSFTPSAAILAPAAYWLAAS